MHISSSECLIPYVFGVSGYSNCHWEQNARYHMKRLNLSLAFSFKADSCFLQKLKFENCSMIKRRKHFSLETFFSPLSSQMRVSYFPLPTSIKLILILTFNKYQTKNGREPFQTHKHISSIKT